MNNFERAKEIPKENKALQAKVEELEAWKSDMLDIINNSQGVVGWHLNGDMATWGEFDLSEEQAKAEVGSSE